MRRAGAATTSSAAVLAVWLAAAPLCSPGVLLAGESGQPAPPGGVETLWKRGEEAFRAGDVDAALAAFQEALDLDTGRARSWNYRGGARFARGDREGALLDFRRAAELDPQDARIWNNLGTACERTGRYAEAESAFVRASAVDPSYPVTHRNLGILYAERLGRPEDARRAWLRYLELVPSGPDAEAVRRGLDRLPAPGATPPSPAGPASPALPGTPEGRGPDGVDPARPPGLP